MDQSLFFTINRDWVVPWLDKPMATLSSWDAWWPVAVIGALWLLIFGGFRGRAALVCIALSIGLTDGLVMQMAKKSVARPRPNQVLEGVRILDLQKATPRMLAIGLPVKERYSEPSIRPVQGRSFPSGHAANNFVLATVLTLFFRRWGWLYFIPAVLVAYSRVYVGSHYPSDVIVGAVLAAGLSVLCVAIVEAIWRRFGARILPRLYKSHPSLFV